MPDRTFIGCNGEPWVVLGQCPRFWAANLPQTCYPPTKQSHLVFRPPCHPKHGTLQKSTIPFGQDMVPSKQIQPHLAAIPSKRQQRTPVWSLNHPKDGTRQKGTKQTRFPILHKEHLALQSLVSLSPLGPFAVRTGWCHCCRSSSRTRRPRAW